MNAYFPIMIPYNSPACLIESFLHLTASIALFMDSSDQLPLFPYVFFLTSSSGAGFSPLGFGAAGFCPIGFNGPLLSFFGTCWLVLNCYHGCWIGNLAI
jgi:hypothetical protein